MPAPVPFYLLCGSLGAGKTTLLMRLLEYWKSQGLRAGVLMNEAGEVSIDGPRAGTIAEQVMNLAYERRSLVGHRAARERCRLRCGDHRVLGASRSG